MKTAPALAVLLLFLWGARCDWEVAVAGLDSVELLGRGGEVVGLSPTGAAPSSLAYDRLGARLFFTATNKTLDGAFHTALYSLGLQAKGFKHGPPLFLLDVAKQVGGLAYDQVNRSLYWTDTEGGRIVGVALGEDGLPLAPPEVLLQLRGQRPEDLVIDHCTRALYWSNANLTKPSIERYWLETGETGRVSEVRGFLPLGLALSEAEGLVYFATVQIGGYGFTVERLHLATGASEELLSGSHRSPYRLALDPLRAELYATDWANREVWKLGVGPAASPRPVSVRRYSFRAPQGILVMSQVTASLQHCLNTTAKDEGDCGPEEGLIGGRCVGVACLHYCLHGGECTASPGGDPLCLCASPHVGPRCQYPTALCPLLCTLYPTD